MEASELLDHLLRAQAQGARRGPVDAHGAAVRRSRLGRVRAREGTVTVVLAELRVCAEFTLFVHVTPAARTGCDGAHEASWRSQLILAGSRVR